MNNKPINFIFNKKRIITFVRKWFYLYFTGVFVINDIHKVVGLWRGILEIIIGNDIIINQYGIVWIIKMSEKEKTYYEKSKQRKKKIRYVFL